MAIAFLSQDKFNKAEVEANKTGGDLTEIYKKMGGLFVEGANQVIESTKKVAAVFDEVKKKGAKKSKKLGAAKKKKK